jgi:hypothetical protein
MVIPTDSGGLNRLERSDFVLWPQAGIDRSAGPGGPADSRTRDGRGQDGQVIPAYRGGEIGARPALDEEPGADGRLSGSGSPPTPATTRPTPKAEKSTHRAALHVPCDATDRALHHHGLQRFDTRGHAEASEANVHSLPRFFHPGRDSERAWCVSSRHGFAFPVGIDTRILQARGKQRCAAYFNINRNIPNTFYVGQTPRARTLRRFVTEKTFHGLMNVPEPSVGATAAERPLCSTPFRPCGCAVRPSPARGCQGRERLGPLIRHPRS